MSATITATSDDNPELKATCTVTFKKAGVGVTGIALDRTELTLPDGTSAQLTATVTPSKANNKVVIWDCLLYTSDAADE